MEKVKRPIKVAFLDYSNIFAGAERVLSTIISNIDRREIEPVLIFRYPQEHHKGYDKLDCRKIHLYDGKKWWMGSDRWRHPLRGTDFLKRNVMGWKLRRLLKKEKIDILHVNLLRPDCFALLRPTHIAGIAVIGHQRAEEWDWMPPRRVQEQCDMIVCVSEFVKNHMEQTGVHTKIKVVYDSIDIKHFNSELSREEAKRELGFPEGSVLISSVGQLSLHKGHDNAILAFDRLAGKFPKAVLYIAGGGSKEELAYYKGIADECRNANGRIFFSEKQVSNIKDVYRASDLVLSLTKEGEAFGLVPYEAALMGSQFIAPDMGAVKEFIVDGESGLLVDTNDLDAVTAKMEWALTHAVENEEMNVRAVEIVKSRITPERMVAGLTGVYKELKS